MEGLRLGLLDTLGTCWRSLILVVVVSVVGGTQSLVDGSYEYFHYLQDRIDDNVSSILRFEPMLANQLNREMHVTMLYLSPFIHST
jgi:hypothetical protein